MDNKYWSLTLTYLLVMQTVKDKLHFLKFGFLYLNPQSIVINMKDQILFVDLVFRNWLLHGKLKCLLKKVTNSKVNFKDKNPGN